VDGKGNWERLKTITGSAPVGLKYHAPLAATRSYFGNSITLSFFVLSKVFKNTYTVVL